MRRGDFERCSYCCLDRHARLGLECKMARPACAESAGTSANSPAEKRKNDCCRNSNRGANDELARHDYDKDLDEIPIRAHLKRPILL